MEEIGVLFVCLGNICRSPTAEAVFSKKVADGGLRHRIRIDSCGIGGWHVGQAPDSRATMYASQRGYDLSALRARQLESADFVRFDFILPMDRSNLQDLQRACPGEFAGELRLFLEYSERFSALEEVPDPYFGGDQGFERVLDLIEDASEGLLGYLGKHCFE